MNIFVIGGTGLLGYHAIRELLKRGHRISTVALPPLPAPGIIPSEVPCTLANISTMTDKEALALLNGHDAMLFAAGADDRTVPTAPAYEYFYKANVAECSRLVSLARKAGIKRAVILGSYFVHFNRIWPELKLAERHPYIRSRVEQEDAVIAAGGKDMDVMILELPYIFGTIPGRVPLWIFLVRMINSFRKMVYFPAGGTTMLTVRQVAQAIVGALEHGQGGERYPVGGVNMTWVDFIGKILAGMGQKKKIITVPTILAKLNGLMMRRDYRKEGKESGLDPVHFMDLQSRETFIDAAPGMRSLGYGPDDLDAALSETVELCMKVLTSEGGVS